MGRAAGLMVTVCQAMAAISSTMAARWAASVTVLPQQKGAWPETRHAGHPSGSRPFRRAMMAAPVLASYPVAISSRESWAVIGISERGVAGDQACRASERVEAFQTGDDGGAGVGFVPGRDLFTRELGRDRDLRKGRGRRPGMQGIRAGRGLSDGR